MSIQKDKMTGDEMRELLDKKHAWDDGIHNREFINDIRRHNWVLINNYPLAKLGSVEDPYNRLIDPDNDYAMSYSDLSEPIVIAPDRKTVLDGNHRVYKAREMGKTHLPAYFPMVKENKFNFKLVDKEISEARLYRTSRNFGEMDGRTIADLLYLNFLTLVVFAKDEYKSQYAKAYARQTVQYGTFSMFRSHATDLYLLAYQINTPKNKNINLKQKIESTRFLKNLQFDPRKFYFIVSKIARGNLNKSELTTYMFRLEAQLKISNANFKQYRRYIVDWENLKFSQRQFITSKLLQDFRRLGRGSEMVSSLTDMAKYKKYRLSTEVKSKEYKEPKPSFTKRAVGTVAGAVAGRYAGKKIAQKLGKDVDKYKKAGTGIGAIAGYWASGRKRQK